MNRFPQEALFDRLASHGALGVERMAPLAVAIAEFHRSAERRSDHGGKAGMSWVIEGNAAGFAEFGRTCLDPSTAYRVTDDSCRELECRAETLERRRRSGFVRQCHGDLHLRNIVLLDGRPTLFDGVEFNDEISCTDVWYDSTLAEQAELVLRAGHSVVADAVYARAEDRRVIEQVAMTTAAPFIGLWLEAPESVLIDRTAQRRNDASDADASIVRMQQAQGVGDLGWYRLDASAATSSVLADAGDRVRKAAPDALERHRR